MVVISSLLTFLVVVICGFLIKWKFRVHEIISFLLLPLVVIPLMSWIAGFYHKSHRIKQMTFVISGIAYVVYIPLGLLGLIIGMGFAGVR
ncbi:MAG: hypothetical protein CMN21_11675 [Rubinisphaera sp.]|nr:hypothetical protein [Rubinisphaera sp.]